MAGATGYRFTFATRGDTQQPQHEPTPLFERIGNDEFAELQVSVRIKIAFSLIIFIFYVALSPSRRRSSRKN